MTNQALQDTLTLLAHVKEMRGELDEILERLVMLAVHDGASGPAIGKALGVSGAAVRKRWPRAVAHTRETGGSSREVIEKRGGHASGKPYTSLPKVSDRPGAGASASKPDAKQQAEKPKSK